MVSYFIECAALASAAYSDGENEHSIKLQIQEKMPKGFKVENRARQCPSSAHSSCDAVSAENCKLLN